MNITGTDLKLTEDFIDKFADTPEQAEAVKKVIGFEDKIKVLSTMYTPDSPPYVPPVFEIDREAHLTELVETYRSWVESFPDDDPTPLRDRQRALLFTERNLARLEAKRATTNGDNR